MHSSPVMPPATLRPAARLFGLPLMLLLLGLLLVGPASFCAAVPYYVSTTGNDTNPGTQASPFLTIQTALNNASTGDTVTLAAGTYTGKGNVDLDMAGKSITVNSVSGAATTIINCGGNATSSPKVLHRAFYFHTSEKNVAISGLTIENGYETGNIYSLGANGGAIDVESGSTVTMMDCTFTQNNCSNGGGVFNNGTTTLTRCILSNNIGEGIYNGGTTTLTACTSNGNTGGGVYNSGSVTLTGCDISGNISSNDGGGLNNLGTAVLMNCTINGNTGYYGGGIFTQISIYSANAIDVSNCTINNNTTSGTGGGVQINGPATFVGCIINSNHASSGGGVSSNGSPTLTGCILSGNLATAGSGGGIYNDGNPNTGYGLTLTNCLLTGNMATKGNGGGVDNASGATALLQFCTLAINNATGTGTQGGALENDGAATLTDDILWGNTAPYAAGIGIATTGNPVTTVTYSDIQGGLSGTGNLNKDPLFVNPTNDFHLTAASPCLHTGIAITGITTDLDGKTRADPPSRGAYEIVGIPITNGATTLASSLNPSVTGQSVIFTATVTAISGNPALAGSVQFAIDGVNVNGPVSLSGSGTAIATTTTSSLTAGSHPVTATFTPTNPYTGTTSASITQVVNAPATNGTLGLTSSVNPSVTGQSVTFTATVTAISGNPALAGSVQFAIDGVNVNGPASVSGSGTVTATTASNSLTVGTHQISATFTSTNPYTGGTSAAITQFVNIPPTNGTLTLASSLNPAFVGQSVTFTATVTAVSGSPALAGSVQFAIDGVNVNGPASVSGSGTVTATITSSSLAAGTHRVTATFTSTNPYTGGTAVTLAQIVRVMVSPLHLLWDNVSGQISVWNFSDPNPVATCQLFGPYLGWTAKTIAQGPDGNVRILWTNTDGHAALWNLGDPSPVASSLLYGPFPGWTATALAVGPDNAAHLLWDNVNGQVALWNTTDPSPTATALIYGPYSGWSGVAIAIGPNNHERLLWDNVSGQMSLWNMSDRTPVASSLLYGPFPGWTATALAVGPDNAAHLLWDNVNGQVSLWNTTNPSPTATALIYGPYGGWSGVGIAIGEDNAERLLWDNVTGPASLWNLTDPAPVASSLIYGPFTGWTAVAVSASP